MSEVYTYQKKEEESKSQTDRKLPDNSNNKSESPGKGLYIKKIKISISIIFAIICLIIFILLFVYKPWKKKNKLMKNETDETVIQNEINHEDFKNELIFTTKVNDLRRIIINQSSYENMIIDGIETKMKLFRITNYDIFILSEKIVGEEFKHNFNKTYIASVSMVSQCLSKEDEKCNLKEYVDLSSNTKTNLRNLKELNDLKDIPVPLCLVNFTDTNIIISTSCPESLSENIKQEISSDFKYFRPTIKTSSDRIDEMNLTVSNNIKNLRRKSKGLCNIENEMDSLCDSDINITKSSEGYLLSFSEKSFTNITTDIKNSLKKSKTINLVDNSSNMNSLNHEKYKEVLDDFLLKLTPYIKDEENIVVEDIVKQYNSKLLIDKRGITRHLTQDEKIYNNYFIDEESLFFKEVFGAKINLNLKIDSGLNAEASKSLLNLNYDTKENSLVTILQYSNLNQIIKKLMTLSNAGNYLADQLYKYIKNNLDNLTKQISIEISNLNSLIVYKDLTEIFDSTLSLNSLKILPIDIIEESNNLVDKLDKKLKEIDEGEFTNNSFILQKDINDFLEEKYNLMNDTFNNLNDLQNLLQSPKNKFTEISTYYLNNTPTSYAKTINDVEDIFNKYNKVDYLNNSIEQILNNFENNYKFSIEKSKKIVNNLYSKLKNGTFEVENAKEDDYKKIIDNLNNSDNISNIIVNKMKDNIRKILNQKNEENKLSNIDKIKYKKIINDSKDIGNNLDNDEIIDKSFDMIISNFRDNFTNIMKYMDKIKEEKITLIDEVLVESIFSTKDKRNMKSEISNCGLDIIIKIKNENNDYISLIKEAIDNFLNENLDNLNSAILDLNILLSEESLNEISYYYNYAFYSSLNAILNDIDYIKTLANLFYGSFNSTLQNMLSIIKDSNEFTVVSYIKVINQNYYKYHNILKGNIEKLRNYINNQLYNDFLDEYKYMIVTIKELLLSIKNNKISDIYPGISQFEFYKNHVNDIDYLNNRIDNYFSLDSFNSVYLPALNDFKINKTEKEFEIINNYIDSQNAEISKSGVLAGNKYDFCINMTTTGKYSDYSACSKNIYEKYIYETTYSIYAKGNLESRERFERVSGIINETANYYNSKMNMIKNSLLLIEEEVINKNILKGYLSPIENTIDSILSQKYGDEIVKTSYNYYKNILDEKVKELLNIIGNKWEGLFDSLEIEINKHLNEFKYSLEDFGVMAELYLDLYTNNISTQYFNSIINLGNNEFLYTISYYYNYLLGLVNSTYLYIINNIPTNELMLNRIIDLKKDEINDEFNKIIKRILESKNNSSSIDNQINILKNEETDFFSLNSILSEHINNISNYLKNRTSKISQIDNGKSKDEYAIASKLFLENSELGKQINSIFEEIYDKIFIYLNEEKFKDIINNNWIIDQNNIINQLNISFFNSNKDIYNDFLVAKENYTSLLESEINKYYTKDSVIKKIKDIYNEGLNLLDTENGNNYKNNLFAILDRIYEHFYNESKRINNTAVSYNSDFSKINRTIKQYKEKIYNEIKTMYVKILDDFRNNIINNFYKDYIEIGLDDYIFKSKIITKNFKDYKLLNSSYNLKEIIDDIIGELTSKYKEIVKRQIDYEYNTSLNNILKLDSLEEFLDDEIEFEYCQLLLPVLKQKAIYQPGITGYPEYDLSDTIKGDIDSNFIEKMNNIKNIFSIIKGNNYEVLNTKAEIVSINGVNIQTQIPNWIDLDFSNISLKLIDIENYFESFISYEKTYEENYINDKIFQIINSNFNKSLDNIFFSYGKDFFERAFKFNEFFRLKDLFNNLGYSLMHTVNYYISKNKEINEINKEFPKELKEKMYNLNNIDKLIMENKNSIMESINTKIEEFIRYLKDNLINNYIEFMKNDALISMSFDNKIRQILNNGLNIVKNDLESNYVNILQSYLNEMFINSYNQTLNKETDNILNLFKEKRDYLIGELSDLFKLEPENILEDINIQINKTINSINEYNSHLTSFKIFDELIEYLYNYGEDKIKPIYDEFKKQIDKISNNQIISNFEKNSKNYEDSFNVNEFINLSNKTLLNLKKNYLDNMTSYINDYYTNYHNNFDKEISNENQELLDVNMDNSFGKLFTNYDNTKLFITTLKEFNEYEKKITKNINSINIAFKESQKLIEDNNYEEENSDNFRNKLLYLKELSIDYYHQINESYYRIRQQLDNSLNNIYDELNKCINITYDELIKEYKKISEEEEPLSEEYKKNEENLDVKKYRFIAEDTTYYISTSIKNLETNTKIDFKILFENNNYSNPKLVATIINKNRPKNMVLDIYSLYGYCAQKGIEVDTNFNEVTYKMDLLYDTKYTNINITTYTFFEKYEYTNEVYEYEDSDETECFVVAYIKFCINTLNCNDKKILSSEKFFNDKKEHTKTNFVKY